MRVFFNYLKILKNEMSCEYGLKIKQEKKKYEKEN